MLINYILLLLIGFSTVAAFIVLFRKLVLRYNIFIIQGIPLIGGISMGLSFLIVCSFSFFLDKTLSFGMIGGAIIAALIMLLFGALDDWHALTVRGKFLVQIIATSLLVLFGIRTHIVNIPGPLNIIITFIWIIGITNAFNHLDVTDGLAAGVALIVSLAFFVVSILNADSKAVILSLALAGVTLGFLTFNFPPARIYMGNAGSHFLGFALGALAVMISYASLDRKVALLTPLLILAFPIFDTFFVILIRIINKKIPFKKSNDHLVLRFLALGYSKKKALLIMLSLCLFFSLSGVFLSQVPNVLGIAIVGFVILVSLILTKKMSAVKVNG